MLYRSMKEESAMLNNSQIAYVRAHLIDNGQIGRNHCLSKYISRLGSIIHRLRNRGMNIVGGYEEVGNGRDYVYRLIKAEPEVSQGNFTKILDSFQGDVA